MADFVVLSTEAIFMYCRILLFLSHCFVTLEVLIRCLYTTCIHYIGHGKYGPTSYNTLLFGAVCMVSNHTYRISSNPVAAL